VKYTGLTKGVSKIVNVFNNPTNLLPLNSPDFLIFLFRQLQIDSNWLFKKFILFPHAKLKRPEDGEKSRNVVRTEKTPA